MGEIGDPVEAAGYGNDLFEIASDKVVRTRAAVHCSDIVPAAQHIAASVPFQHVAPLAGGPTVVSIAAPGVDRSRNTPLIMDHFGKVRGEDQAVDPARIGDIGRTLGDDRQAAPGDQTAFNRIGPPLASTPSCCRLIVPELSIAAKSSVRIPEESEIVPALTTLPEP